MKGKPELSGIGRTLGTQCSRRCSMSVRSLTARPHNQQHRCRLQAQHLDDIASMLPGNQQQLPPPAYFTAGLTHVTGSSSSRRFSAKAASSSSRWSSRGATSTVMTGRSSRGAPCSRSLTRATLLARPAGRIGRPGRCCSRGSSSAGHSLHQVQLPSSPCPMLQQRRNQAADASYGDACRSSAAGPAATEPCGCESRPVLTSASWDGWTASTTRRPRCRS